LNPAGEDHLLNFFNTFLKSFTKISPFIVTLGNKDLKVRHYNEIFNALKLQEPLESFTYHEMIKLGAA